MKKIKFTKISSTLLLSHLILSAPIQILATEQQSQVVDQTVTSESSVETSSEQTVVEIENTTDSITSDEETEGTTETTEPIKPTETTETTESTTDSSQETETSKPDTTHESTESSVLTETTSATKPKPSKETKPAHKKPVKKPAVSSKPAEPIRSLTSDQEAAIHFEKDESVETFIRKIGESARKLGQENDLYASVMIAQAILESGSGQSKLAQAPCYNLFGIKGSYKNKSTCLNTQEEGKDGHYYTIQAVFRVYDNYEESLADYAKLLKNGLTGDRHFYEGAWKSNTRTYQEATKFLTGRYATDSKYNQKLDSLIETYDLTKYDEKENVKLNPDGFLVPVKNYRISSHFGPRSNEFHRGLDLAAAQGEPILAAKKGKVIIAEFHPSWGNYVVLEHEDGTTTLYAHQQEYHVKVGQQVNQGQTIGYVGSTGNSTGSHLHFEVCSDASLAQSKLIKPETVLFK